MPPSSPLRRDLLFALGFLFSGALLLGVVGLSVLLPVFADPSDALVYLIVLFAADLAVVFLFAADFLRRNLVRPIEGLLEDVRRIADGDHEHRVRPMSSEELGSIQARVNALADRLVRDQHLLSENVRSLERSNQELREARDQVLQSARLASVGALAAGIAHEVGNPLGAIMGYVDVARARADRAGADTELFDSIRTEAARIDRIVRSLLDYARPAPEGALPADLVAVLTRVRELLEAQGKLGNVKVEWELGESPVPPVDADAHRLEQVMVNLLLNAADALEETPGGRIHVSVGTDEGGVVPRPARRESDPPDVSFEHRRRARWSSLGDAGGRGAGSVAVIRVRDNGPGVPQENLASLFDPFFTTKEPGKGSGLGLFVCAQLVEGMGGHIEAANADGGGAVFTVRLPTAPSPEEERES